MLEVLIATAILAVIFAVTSGTIISGGFMQAKAPLYSRAALLVRSVVLDLEAKYASEGFPEDNEEGRDCDLPRDAGRGYTCRYDLEKLDIDEGELAQMGSELLEQLTVGVGEGGNLLQAFAAFQWMVTQGNMGQVVHPLTCPVNINTFLDMCEVDIGKIVQNISLMVGFFPLIIGTAASKIRKLRVKIFHSSEAKEPILEVETFIVAVPEQLRPGAEGMTQ